LHNQYKRPFFLNNGHFETIYPALFRKIKNPPPAIRKILQTPDDDFLELDWMLGGNKRIIVLQHGLEGSSERAYIVGMAKIFFNAGYDVCAWNFRGCGSKMNKSAIFYHSGATYDLDLVVNETLKTHDDITLIGFSLGGNLTLKYLGELPRDMRIKRTIVISVPLDLASTSDNLNTRKCYLYEQRFLRNLLQKVSEKSAAMPGKIDISNIHKVKSVRDFDEYFTAPIHGFNGSSDYYEKNSSSKFIHTISVPTLIVNAQNDPMLTEKCFDGTIIHTNKNIEFLTPRHGGHVGFAQFDENETYWSEKIALDFAQRT
jgi:uncharacterized protein